MKTITSVVVTHANIMTNHVSHGASHKVRLVRIDVDTQSNRFSRAHRVRCRHSGTANKSLATIENNCPNVFQLKLRELLL